MPQDFSGQNLRGHSFKGQDLVGGNFSYADIRGADFSGSNLRGANFTGATAGLLMREVVLLVTIPCLLSLLAAFSSSLASIIVSTNIEPNFFLFRGSIILIFLIILSITNTQCGILAFGIALTIILTVTAAIAVIVTFLGQVQGTVALTLGIIGSIVITIVSAATTGGAVSVVGKSGIISVATTNLLGVGIAIRIFAPQITIISITDLLINVIAIGLGIGQGSYIINKALVGSEKFSILRPITLAWVTTGGTRFRNADLTNANFTNAVLKGTDFRNAITIHTRFQQAKMLNYVRPGKSYLHKVEVRQLLITGQGQDKNFDYQNLRGANLQGANLTDASFIGANLNEANLQDADLTRAKLVQTQLDGTDFTGANLTGAYIEDWNITTDTIFDGVRCEYVYMRLPTPDNPDPHRKPDNRQEVFADGEFGDFIKPIFDTLDLYHNQGIDPRAIAISFKQLAENHPEADLRIVGMEVRGEDKFLLRAKTAIAADKSELSAEYFATYNQLKALAEQEVKALIAEKDGRIADLQNMVVTALQRPSFYSNVEQVGFMTNNPGGFSVGGSVDGDINNVQGENNQQRVSNKSSSFNLQGAQFAGGLVNADTVNAQQIGGNITNYNPEQKQNLAQAAAEIQQLLNQLSQTYPTTTTSQKMSVVAKAVDEIESNPTLKARVIGALKAGGTEAFKELIDHPLVNILLASIDGWQEAE
ncbi:pentapeptide repeat-containing protein [Nostoc sp.]|uniref:pentapeptide repeat-containing protein n=1 Tax=Nostoc sp. TaxID=1180 RepID=UPI003593772A